MSIGIGVPFLTTSVSAEVLNQVPPNAIGEENIAIGENNEPIGEE